MSLSDNFEALKLPDGRPDIIRRRVHLDNLISRLMSSEIRHLRLQLEKIQQSKKGNDFFKGIPHELCLKIVDFLYLEDLLRMRLVCHSWHENFSNLDFCIHILKRYFHLPLECYFKRSGVDCINQEKTKEKGNWIQKFIINRIRRENGITCRKYVMNDHFPHSISYCNGRIAIQTREIIEVRDLISGISNTFITPTREQMSKWLLSDKYLIGLVHGPTKLLAWDLESKIAYSIRLPAKILQLSASRDHVGIVMVSYEFLTWVIGGTLRKLQNTKLDIDCQVEKYVSTDIFFHSEEKDTVFLISYSRIKLKSIVDKKYATKITVQIFVAGAITRVHHKILYTFTEPIEYRSTLISNDNIIGMEILEFTSEMLYNHITYDMNKKEFHCLEVLLHPGVRKTLYRRNHIFWRDQIFNPVLIGGYASLQVITISKSLIEVWNEFSKIDHSLKQFSVISGETRSHSTCTAIETEILPSLNNDIEIWGDDSFIVLLDSGAIKVWEFDNFGLEPFRSRPLEYKSFKT